MTAPRAYYNENDPRMAEWLRELIKAKLIADGEVDTRSIVDVRSADLEGFRQCHFFAGLGGWSAALRLAEWSDERAAWTGSCPCQPWSAANVHRRVRGEDDARHLWPAWFRLIRERRPVVVFGEQVASDDGLAWLDAVCADLEAENYTVGAVDICAAGVGAPHRRQRLFLVADTARARLEGHRRHVDHEHEPGRHGPSQVRPRRDVDFWNDVTAVRCRDGRDRPIPMAHGLSDGLDARRPSDEPAIALEQRRQVMIHGYGNAIVPQVAAAFIEAYRSVAECSS